MKKKIMAALLTSAGLMAATSSASASDGTIQIDGLITPSTCKINGGANNIAVVLPTVRATALASVGAVAGRMPFTLALTDCPTSTGSPTRVGVYFEPGPTVNLASGRLIPDRGTGKASGVEVNVLNDQFRQIKIGSANPDSPLTNIDTGGNATLNYFAEYYAKDAVVESGLVNTRVQYSLVYQ